MKNKKTKSKRNLIRNLVIVTTLLIIGISAIYAYNNNRESDNNMMSNMNMMGMNDMNGNMMQTCMALMKDSEGMSKEEMLSSMDKDNDGKCDMCDMSIEMCKQMMNN